MLKAVCRRRGYGQVACLVTMGVLVVLSVCASPAGAVGTVLGWGSLSSPTNIANVVGAAAGYEHGLALKDDGVIATWGANTRGQRNVPVPNTGFVAVAAGLYHSLGLRSGGSVVAWGDTSSGRCRVPAPNEGFIAVSAGEFHSLALRRDGSIAAWGGNADHQRDIPLPNSGFTAISAGRFHSVALRADGSIAAWGRNDYGQCNVPVPNSGFIAAAAGYSYSLGLRADGSIVAWGKNDYGQCTVPAPNTGFTSMAGGYAHTVAIRADGAMVAWGANNFGQCNLPVPNEGCTVVAAGFNHSVVVRDAPFALAIYDAPADEGGELVLSWRRHPLDPLAVTRYDVQKYAGAWLTLETFAPASPDSYSVHVATSDILTIGRPAPGAYYRVVAQTSVPGLSYATPAVFGCSIDNLPPPPPVAHVSDGTDYRIIYWDKPDVADYGSACLYRGTVAGFTAAQPLACPDEVFYVENHLAWYFYRVVCTDTHGNVSAPSNEVHGQFPTAVDGALPQRVALGQNHPNPFNPATVLPFELPAASFARLTIHDLSGRLVRVLLDGEQPAGRAEVAWDGRDDAGRPVSSGMYVARLDAGGRVLTQRMALLR